MVLEMGLKKREHRILGGRESEDVLARGSKCEQKQAGKYQAYVEKVTTVL